jgi:hypothetical protein
MRIVSRAVTGIMVFCLSCLSFCPLRVFGAEADAQKMHILLVQERLVGSYVDDQWKSDAETAQFIKNGDIVKVYSQTGVLGEWSVGKIAEIRGETIVKTDGSQPYDHFFIKWRKGYNDNNQIVNDTLAKYVDRQTYVPSQHDVKDVFNEMISIPNLQQLLDENKGVLNRQPGLADRQTRIANKLRLNEMYSSYQFDIFQPPDYFDLNSNKDVYAFSIIGNWNPLPRIPEIIENPVNDTSIPRIQNMLEVAGLGKNKPVIKKTIVVDLDGDGVDEKFILSSNIDNSNDYETLKEQYREKYSILLMVKKSNGKEEYIPVFECYKNLSSADIGFIADLNGDEKMEFMVEEEVANVAVVSAEALGYMVFHLYKMGQNKLEEIVQYERMPR